MRIPFTFQPNPLRILLIVALSFTMISATAAAIASVGQSRDLPGADQQSVG